MEAILCSRPEKPAFPVDCGLIRCFHQTLHQSNFHGCPPSHRVTSCCDVLSPRTLYLHDPPLRKTAWVSISQIQKLRSRWVEWGTWELLSQIIRGWQVAFSVGCLAFAHGQGVELLPKCWLSHRECESLVLWKEEEISCQSAPVHCHTHTLTYTRTHAPPTWSNVMAILLQSLLLLCMYDSFPWNSGFCVNPRIIASCPSACMKVSHIQKAPLFSGHLVYLTVLIPLVCPLSPSEVLSHVLPHLFAPTFLPFFHSVS